MNTMSGILLICVALIAWEISTISFTNKKVIVHGEIPGQKLGLILFAVACVVIMVWRWGTGFWTWACAAGIVVATLLNFLMKNGLSEYGMYLNGWSTSYKDMKYFDYERKDGKWNRIRINCTRKDTTLMFTDDQMNLAFAYFDKNKVPDMETYTMLQRRKKEKESRR